MKLHTFWRSAAVSLGTLALAFTTQAQDLSTPCPNRIVSWNLDDTSTINPTDLAGLAPAVNWVDSWLNNITIGLPDNQGSVTTLNLGWASFNTWHVQGNHPGLDANGTANRELLNGYLNSGPAGWNPSITNTWVSLTNIPYAQYDVVVYFNSDTSGRHGTIDNGTTTYYFSTVGSPSRSGANALFLPTTETNSSVFPSADFAFFPGMTSPNAIFTEYPKSGNDQWLGICAFQVIESSNTYVLYGATPATQIVPVGQPAKFSVIAGGQNPRYQWRRNGANIANATNATYAIAATVAGQDGSYDVVVTNSFSSSTSSVANLTFYAPKTLEWAGNNAAWDTTTSDWTTNGGISTLAYTDTDNVRFGPLGSANSTVTLGATLAPSSIVVSNSSYTLASGALSGTGSLRLRNNATLILDTVDTRTGPTVIDSGSTFQLDSGDTAGSMGAGALTNNGALLFNASGDEGYGYPVYGTGSLTNLGPSGRITLGNTINATYLAQAGTGELLLQGDNHLTGMAISSGTVLARSAGALGNAPVTVSGGELQLFFNFEYVGSALTLAGGTLRGGISGSQVFQGPVALAADASINVDSGSSLTLSNAVGLNGGAHNLVVGGGGRLILAGANNSWAGVSITAGTLQIGNGGASGTVGSGNIQDDGALAFDLAGNLTVANTFGGAGAINQIGSGTTTLTADNAANGFVGPLNVTNGTLRVNGTSGSGAVTVAGGSLGGTGTIGGPVSILAGGTLAPGASVGTLTLASDLTIEGNLSVEVNKSLTQSNDVVTVGGALANVGTGVVSVSNLGPALVAGDSFKLFSQPVTGGETMTVSGAGAVWMNKLAVDGSIQVVSAAVPRPVINRVTMPDATSLVFSGTNGNPRSGYHVLSSTNAALPLGSWTVEASGSFNDSGAFAVTNAVSPGVPHKFYLLQVP